MKANKSFIDILNRSEPLSFVRHEQREARGGVVEDDGVERRSGAAASAALVVQHDGQRAADPLPRTRFQL